MTDNSYQPPKVWQWNKASGGKRKALEAAREHRDKILSKMPKYKQESASKKKRRIKQSGVIGVTHVVSTSTKGQSYQYWQAAWQDAEGKRRTAKFSIKRYGDKEALELAKKARRKADREAKKKKK